MTHSIGIDMHLRAAYGDDIAAGVVVDASENAEAIEVTFVCDHGIFVKGGVACIECEAGV